jgi:glycosyltransferase involved in cell wall biosynthesis
MPDAVPSAPAAWNKRTSAASSPCGTGEPMDFPKKIVFVGLTDYSNAPTRIRCYNFAAMLAKLGYDASVFSFQEALAPEELKNQEMTAMLNVSEDFKEDLVDRAVPLLEKMGPALFIVQKVHYHAAAVVEVCRRHGWPYALDYDDDDRGRSSLFKDPGVSLRRFGAAGQTDVLAEVARGARFCLVSSQALHAILSAFNDRVHLLETAADTGRFAFVDRSGRDGGRIVWLGQIWGKRILECLDVVCKALRRVYRQGVPFSLHIVGRGMENVLPGYLDLHYPGLPFHFDGWVEPDAVPGVLASMDIGVFPLLPISLDYEWMRAKSPTKLFEYMASGLPVVATRLGEAACLSGDGEALFLAATESEMAEKLSLLLQNQELRLSMGRRARALVEARYCLEATAGKLTRILHSAEVSPEPPRPEGEQASHPLSTGSIHGLSIS